ncbi:MAG: hypothetical protein LIQ30_08575 [Planctomycetes bacterium]|nr:hypothetical protein [Planctomycetota bacterium]MCD7895222.1 hypothetical protein [Planctomycetaceae bacterium]
MDNPGKDGDAKDEEEVRQDGFKGEAGFVDDAVRQVADGEGGDLAEAGRHQHHDGDGDESQFMGAPEKPVQFAAKVAEGLVVFHSIGLAG